MNMKELTCVLSLCAALFSTSTSASLIDFENVPGVGTPTEGLSISDQYLATDGVSFSLEGGGVPVIAEVGNPTTAFSPSDQPLAGQGIGTFFLTDDGETSGLTPQPLIVTYKNPTASASGVVLDIDFNESFTIEARDATGTVLDMIIIQSGDPNTGNRLATPWSFNRPSADVFSIRFIGERTAAGFFGLGFDNFDTGVTAVPVPAAVWLFGSGLLGLVGMARRKKV